MAEGSKRDVVAKFVLKVDDKGFKKADAGIEGVKAASAKATAAAERALAKAQASAAKADRALNDRLAKLAGGTVKQSHAAGEAIEGLSKHLNAVAGKFGLAPVGEGFEALHGVIGKLTTGMPGAAIGFAAVGAALAGLGERTASHALAMKKSAEAAGVELQTFQELAFAAKESGVETSKLTDGMAELSKNVYSAMKGKGDTAKSFRDLGVAFKGTDGKARPLADIMADIADKTKAMGVSSERAGKLQGVLGKSAKEYIPWLAKGSGEMRHAIAMAREYGIVLSAETVKQASQYSKSKKQVAAIFEGIELQLGATVLPHVASVAKGIAGWMHAARPFLQSGLDHYLSEAVAGFKIVGTIIDGVTAAAKGLVGSVGWLTKLGGDNGPMAHAFDAMLNPLKTAFGIIEEIRRTIVGEATQAGYVEAVKAGKGEEYLRHAEAGGQFEPITGEIVPLGQKRQTVHERLWAAANKPFDKAFGGTGFAQSWDLMRTAGAKGDYDTALMAGLGSFASIPTSLWQLGGKGVNAVLPESMQLPTGMYDAGALARAYFPTPSAPGGGGPASKTTNVSVAPTTITVNASTVDADSLQSITRDVMGGVMREASMSLPE